MVPYSPSKWYHFLSQYGTIFESVIVSLENQDYDYACFKTTLFHLQNEYLFFFRSFSPFLRANGWKKWGGCGNIVSVMHKPHSVAIRITILLLYLTFLNLLRCGNNDGIVKLFNDFSKRSDMRTKEVGDVVVVKGCLIDNIL